MLKLHGFALSNYYNAVKMMLLEKGAQFEEIEAKPSQENDYLSKSPMGKVPCLETPDGFLSETSVIIDYIDQAVEGTSLYPRDPWKRAKAAELFKQVELYLDLAVRPCFKEAFFGGKVSDEVKATAKKDLEMGIAAINRRAEFDPYLAGADFTPGDALAFYTMPLATAVGKKMLGIDPVAAIPGAAKMMASVAERPSAKSIADA